ncbi:reverse transcriptase domain-containing protein [Tanacetum coccineum]|uniref:Reverse transcriptase domain-containing protein n=1 Tax=Tanacetum coccineum TaxID=301880 RepID=A0ABQ5BC49_9ASTR
MSTSKTYQQSLADAGSETRPPMLERGSYIPWAILKLQTAKDLQGDALLHYDAEMELMNLILLSIPNDIYNSVDACTSAKDMWKRVERLMRGTIQNKVDRETRFTNEFDQFVAEPGEALVSVYNCFAQLINDLERNYMHFPIVTINTKFLNSLQPEWLKYVTQVRLAKRLTMDTFDDLFDYLQQFEKLVNVSRAKKLEKYHDPLALVAHTGSSSRNTSSYYVTHPTSMVDYEDEYQQDDVHTNSKDPLTSAMLNSSNAGRNNRRAYVQEEIVLGSNAPNETGNVQRTLRTSSSRNTSTVQCFFGPPPDQLFLPPPSTSTPHPAGTFLTTLLAAYDPTNQSKTLDPRVSYGRARSFKEKGIKCMRTSSQSCNSNRQQQQVLPTFVEPFNLVEPIENQAPPVVTMDDTRAMAQLLEAPTVGYEDAIIVPEITADNFELKHGLLTLVQNKQFFRHDKEDPHAHIRYFNKITSTMKFLNVPNTSVKLMLFLFSLEGAARIWLEKEPPRLIITWDDLVSKFINKFFPPSKTTNLRNEIMRFQQRFDETFYEAWDRFNDLLRACPHHGFSELHQLDTFYNALNSNDQDSLNSAAGGNFLDKMPRDCLRIIESKSKVRNSRNKPVVAKVSSSSSTPGISPDVAELKDMVKALLLDKKTQAPAPVKAVEESCVTCGGTHSYRNCPATDGNVYRDNIQEYVSQAAAANFNQGNTGYRAPIANQIRPPGFPPVQQNQGNNQNRYNQNRGNNYNQNQIYRPPINQPPVHQAQPYQAPAPQTQGVTKNDFESYVKANDAVMRNMQDQNQNLQNQMTNLTDMLSKFMNSNTASTSGSGTLPSNTVANPKVDLKGITTRSGVAYQGPTIPTTSSPPKVVERETKVTKDTVPPTNNGSTKDVQPPVIQVQSQVPNSKPVVTPVSVSMPNLKPSIPYPSRRNDERRREKANDQIEKFYKIFKDLSFEISLTDALILMPKFASTLKALIGNKEKLSEMARTPLNEHCSAVILNKLPEKLGDLDKFLILYHSITKPINIAEDIYLKVGKFKFLADFVVVDFDADRRVPLILGRSFLKTGRALIDVYEGELTLHVGKEAITFNLDQTSRYSSNYDDMTANRIDVIEMACEEYSQEVLGFSDVIASGNPTPYCDPIVSTSSPTLTPFGDSDFLLEEVDAFLALKDDPTSLEVDESYYDSEGDILLLESFLDDDPSSPPPNQENYLPEIQKELKICETKNNKSSIDDPPKVELRDLPPHLEYAFLEGDNKLPVIIAKDLSVEEKAALIKVLKSHKRAIAWKLFDIKGINPEFYTHKILLEDDYKPAVQHQRRVNPKIHDVIKKRLKIFFTPD